MCKPKSLDSHPMKIKNNQHVAPKHTRLLGKKRIKQRQPKRMIMYEDDNTLLMLYHCSLLLKELGKPEAILAMECFNMLDVLSRGFGYLPCDFFIKLFMYTLRDMSTCCTLRHGFF